MTEERTFQIPRADSAALARLAAKLQQHCAVLVLTPMGCSLIHADGNTLHIGRCGDVPSTAIAFDDITTILNQDTQ